MAAVCLVLGCYTLLLHHKLSFAVRRFACNTIACPQQLIERGCCFQEDKHGFSVTEAIASHDDQVKPRHFGQKVTSRKPRRLCFQQAGRGLIQIIGMQAVDMHWLQAEIQQQAAVLQNVSGLAEEVHSKPFHFAIPESIE